MLESKFSLETFLPFRNLTKNGIFSVNLFFTPHPFRILTEESTSRFYWIYSMYTVQYTIKKNQRNKKVNKYFFLRESFELK